MFERDGDVACDFHHEFHLVLVEESGFRGMKTENAASRPIDDQRNHRDRPKSALHALLAESGMLVGDHVVGYDRGSVADRAPGHAEPAAVLSRREPDDPEEALLGAAERGRQYLFRARIDDSDPRQPELGGLDRDPAGFAEQL